GAALAPAALAAVPFARLHDARLRGRPLLARLDAGGAQTRRRILRRTRRDDAAIEHALGRLLGVPGARHEALCNRLHTRSATYRLEATGLVHGNSDVLLDGTTEAFARD